jgi:hypothetical protein
MNKKIKIIGCSEVRFWYKDHIGQIFTVESSYTGTAYGKPGIGVILPKEVNLGVVLGAVVSGDFVYVDLDEIGPED